LSDEEIGRTGSDLTIRLRWLDYHGVDYAALVQTAPPSSWTSSVASPDSALIAYGEDVVAELRNVDGAFAELGPKRKLTFAVPYSPPEIGKKRSVVIGVRGYYVVPEESDGETPGSAKPVVLYVDRSYPNPFNPTAHISFGLATGASVSLKIYSVTGQLVRQLHNGPLSRGEYDFVWDGRDESGRAIASGVYFYELRAGDQRVSGKMLAVK
jgi:hypothetical protein